METDIRQAALDAVTAWPRQRDRMPEHRADLLAAAWWAGNRNVAELARACDTARDTVYSDLRARGVDPVARHLPDGGLPRYVPLRHDTADQLASAMSAALLPALLTDEPGPLASAAWMMGKAMTRVAELLNPDASSSGYSAAELAEDLADSLRAALADAHAYRAGIQTEAELAARTAESAVDRCGSEAIADSAVITLGLPNAASVTVTLTQVPCTQPGAGFTVVATGSPLLGAGISGRDHLDIRGALDVIGGVLTRHLAEGAFDDC